MRQTLPPRARLASVAVLVGLVSAACATTRYTQSAIVATPGDVEGGSSASVEIGGLKVRVETTDRAALSKAIPRLTLRLVIDPPELGYSFDPRQVVLKGARGEEWRAQGGEVGPLYPKASFYLSFDAVVPEEGDLELVLGGLARGQQWLDPVTLRLERRSGRSIDRVYWLEVLLAPLAYAPYVH